MSQMSMKISGPLTGVLKSSMDSSAAGCSGEPNFGDHP